MGHGGDIHVNISVLQIVKSHIVIYSPDNVLIVKHLTGEITVIHSVHFSVVWNVNNELEHVVNVCRTGQEINVTVSKTSFFY